MTTMTSTVAIKSDENENKTPVEVKIPSEKVKTIRYPWKKKMKLSTFDRDFFQNDTGLDIPRFFC